MKKPYMSPWVTIIPLHIRQQLLDSSVVFQGASEYEVKSTDDLLSRENEASFEE